MPMVIRKPGNDTERTTTALVDACSLVQSCNFGTALVIVVINKGSKGESSEVVPRWSP